MIAAGATISAIIKNSLISAVQPTDTQRQIDLDLPRSLRVRMRIY
jgi:hypothetical protein